MTGPVNTYSLAEVARSVCGDDLELPDLWLLRLVRSGEVSALRISRGVYRFTQPQIDALLSHLDTKRATEPEPEVPAAQDVEPRTLSLTPGSARTLRKIDNIR